MALVYEQQTLIAMQKVHRRKQKSKAKERTQNAKNEESFSRKTQCFPKQNIEETR